MGRMSIPGLSDDEAWPEGEERTLWRLRFEDEEWPGVVRRAGRRFFDAHPAVNSVQVRKTRVADRTVYLLSERPPEQARNGGD